MAKMFTKGQPVTVIQNWDSKGTVRILNGLKVYSCGAKQMILVDDAGVKFAGSLISPDGKMGNFSRAIPRVDNAVAYEMAMKVAGEVIESETAHFNQRINQFEDNSNFVGAMKKALSALHEPRVIVGQELWRR